MLIPIQNNNEERFFTQLSSDFRSRLWAGWGGKFAQSQSEVYYQKLESAIGDILTFGEVLRGKSQRVLQDFKFDPLHFGNQEEKSASSRFGSVKTSPELEVIPKHWAIASEGFPPGVTVDELKKYGRRKQLNHLRPQDNLRLEEGSLKLYKSEYKRRYLPFRLPKVFQPSEEKLEEDATEVVDLPQDSHSVYSFCRPILRRPQNNLFVMKDQPMETLTEKNAKYVPFPEYERRKLLRRSTALRQEGEIANETEVRKAYVDYKNPKKAELVRKLPSLKLEGEYEPLTTEQRDKFIAYLLSRRPVLEKKKTSLKMEGNFDFLTEKELKYVPHEFSERPRIRKRSTSLKLEGEVEFSPEYKNSFVNFPRSRPVTYKPSGKIRPEGEFENQTETKTQFVNFENISIPQSAKPENNLHIEGEMEISPEYRNNFVDFPRERPFLRRPFNQLKPEGNLELLTENSEKYSDFGALEKSVNLPVTSHLDPGHFPSEDVENIKQDEVPDEIEPPKESLDKLEGEAELTKEKQDKFRFLLSEKDTNRRPLSLKQERQFFFVPEPKASFLDRERNLKVVEDLKSNSSSPRKKASKGKAKLDFETDKKSILESLHRKPGIKRLKEATPEKTVNGIPNENLAKLEEEKRKESQLMRQNLRFSEILPHEGSPSQKEFPAFKVLDVKGQLGCQSMLKDGLGSEKSTSDEENPTYRLEVFNSGERSPGFHKSNRKIFPNSALDSKTLEEAEMRARQRAENYVKIVKSPEVPNCLLDKKHDTENRWKMPEKLYPLSPQESLSKRSFVILDDKGIGQDTSGMPKECFKKGWMPDSLDSMLS